MQANTASGWCIIVFYLIEAFKYMRQVFFIDATSGIAYFYRDVFFIVSVCFIHSKLYMSILWSEFKCVRQQVINDFIHHIMIVIDQEIINRCF